MNNQSKRAHLLFLSLLILFICFSFTISKTKEEWIKRSIYQILTDRFSRTDVNDSSECDVSLKKYCKGSFKGLQRDLDYIENMGFNAIWISPVVANYPDSYHGYHLLDLYTINPEFGTEQDFIDLIAECHKRDIWMMVDVVANHVGPVGTDYSTVVQFNKAEYYHDYCDINLEDFQTNQWKVEVNSYLITLFLIL